MSVSMKPGATALTVMPREASSLARDLVNPSSACLRRGVIGLSGIAGHAHDRGQVHDPPAARLHHLPHAGPGQAIHRGEIRGDDHVPVLGLHAQQQRVARDGGVVHQDGGQLRVLLELRHQRIDRGGAAGIEHRAAAVASVRRERRAERGRALFAGRGADDACAGATQGERDRVADAARGAGDQCHSFGLSLLAGIFLLLPSHLFWRNQAERTLGKGQK